HPNGNGGPAGDCGEAAYKRFLSSALQEAIQSDDQASRLAFTVQVRVWIAPDGRISNVTIARSSGPPRRPRPRVAPPPGPAPWKRAPPPQLKFPALVALRGRKA